MATYTLQTPATPNFKALNVLSGIELKNRLTIIMQNYGKSIKFVQDSCKVPADITASFMMAFSGGQAAYLPSTSPIYGLMGWSRFYGTPDAKGSRMNARAILNWEKVTRRMTSAEESRLKALNYVWDAKQNSFPEITATLQGNADFNILVGAIFLGQLMDSKAYGIDKANWALDAKGGLHLERIIVVYANGADMSKDSVKKAVNGNYPTAISLIDAIQGTDQASVALINKILGTGGYLDSFVNILGSIGSVASFSSFKIS